MLYIALILIPFSLSLVGVALAYLFGSAFQSASRNTESIPFISSNLLIGAGFVEFIAILVIGIFGALYTKL